MKILTPPGRTALWICLLAFYALTVVLAGLPRIELATAFFLLSILNFITFAIATAALILKK